MAWILSFKWWISAIKERQTVNVWAIFAHFLMRNFPVHLLSFDTFESLSIAVTHWLWNVVDRTTMSTLRRTREIRSKEPDFIANSQVMKVSLIKAHLKSLKQHLLSFSRRVMHDQARLCKWGGIHWKSKVITDMDMGMSINGLRKTHGH